MPTYGIEAKLNITIQALKDVMEFGHAPNCEGYAPVYECCCYDKSQWDIAREALEVIGEL